MEQQKQKCVVTSAGLESTGKRKIKGSDIRNGAVFKSNRFGYYKVVDRVNYDNVTVMFLSTGSTVKTACHEIKIGQVRDPMAPSIYGVGFIGIGDFSKGNSKKALSVWYGMMKRCYCPYELNNNIAYIDCNIFDEWHNFQNFAKWFYENLPDGDDKYELDKDLKNPGNKIYSPDSCLFLPVSINLFLAKKLKSKSGLTGAHYVASGDKFSSRCRNPITGKYKYLGRFNTKIEAHMAWRNCKSKFAYELAMIQERDDIKECLLKWKEALDNFEIYKINI